MANELQLINNELEGFDSVQQRTEEAPEDQALLITSMDDESMARRSLERSIAEQFAAYAQALRGQRIDQ